MTTLIRPPLAMHMANELLSVPVAGLTLAVAAIAVLVAARCARRATTDDRLPLVGVMGAFIFAAQMINFTLPGMPGTSGHLGGGVLLAILLGPASRYRHDGCDPHGPMPPVSGWRTVGPGLQRHQYGRDSLPAWLGALPCRTWSRGQGDGMAAVSRCLARVRGRRYRRRGDGAGRGGCQRRAASAGRPVSRHDDWRPSGHQPVRGRDHLCSRWPTCVVFGPSCSASHRTTRPSRDTDPAMGS